MTTKERKHPAELSLPGDAVLIKQIGAITFYFSKSARKLFVDITDYHCKLTSLVEHDLLEILSVMHRSQGKI